MNADVEKAVEYRAEVADYADALDHIARVAESSRVTSRRLTWIASRARSALAGTDEWRTAPVPKNGISELRRAKVLLSDARQALRDQEAEILRLRKIEEERWSVVATRNAAVMRAEKAEALLRECHEAIGVRTSLDDDMDLAYRITAHLGATHELS